MKEKAEEANFCLHVSYAQIAVFNTDLENPFNDWTPELVNQGFSWREGSTSFRTLDEDGIVNLVVKVVDVHQVNAKAERTIRVPFRVQSGGEVEVASITDGQILSIHPGDYSLFFETWKTADEMWCSLIFSKKFESEAEIVRRDNDLSPKFPLKMGSRPA